MEPDLIPATLDPGTVAAWSSVVAVPTVAGVVQVAVNTGMPVRFASLVALILGVAGGVTSALTTHLPVLTGVVQGATVGLAAAGLWTNLSHKIDTDGE